MSHPIEDIVDDLFDPTTIESSRISLELKEYFGKNLLFVNKEMTDRTLTYLVHHEDFSRFCQLIDNLQAITEKKLQYATK